ncbi:MAG: hypothetical protein IPJ30_01205 [Acidobacteria bacterium]|nr:hypothetical protein [Acidobacteriota bacterium]
MSLNPLIPDYALAKHSANVRPNHWDLGFGIWELGFGILDFGCGIPDSRIPRFQGFQGFQIPGFQIPDSRFQIARFEIPGIPDPNSRFQDSEGSRLGIPNRVAIASSRYHLR